MTKKHLLSIFSVSLFILLGLGSTVNKLHYGAFNYDNKVEDKSEKENYLVKNDGSKVYGENVKWKSGLLTKDQIQIDAQKFKIPEVIGYRVGQTYYGRLGKEYVKRIVHGKINVYVAFTEVTTTSTDHSGFSRTRTYTRTDYYAQKGETGTMIAFGGQKGIIEIVKDCPLAVQMADLSNSKMRRAIKKNSNYLNSIFDVYNNNCKAVTP